MSYSNILSQSSNGITTITINRSNKLNALNKSTIQELHEAFNKANNDSATKVIIITGSGEKAFVAGADISEFADFNVEEGGKLAAQGQALLFDFVEHLSKPVIAAVNGFALGGGVAEAGGIWACLWCRGSGVCSGRRGRVCASGVAIVRKWAVLCAGLWDLDGGEYGEV